MKQLCLVGICSISCAGCILEMGIQVDLFLVYFPALTANPPVVTDPLFFFLPVNYCQLL